MKKRDVLVFMGSKRSTDEKIMVIGQMVEDFGSYDLISWTLMYS